MPAPTLLSLCNKECKRNVRNFTDVGDLEYFQIASILRLITSPEQLHELETNCPQLLGEDAELWQAFIARDVPEWQKKNYKPSNPKNWYKVYKRYMKEHKEEVARDAEKLRLVMEGKRAAKVANTTQIITDPRRLPKLPRDSRMIANNGIPFKSKKTGPGSSFVSGNMRFSEGSRTKTTTGESVLLRARREAKEIGRMNKLLTPMGKIGARSSVIQKAPQAMVDEHARSTAPARIFAPRNGTVKAPRKLDGVSNQYGTISASALEERERRLKAIQSDSRKAEATVKPTIISDDDDGDDYDQDDDIFGDVPRDPAPARNSAPRRLFNPSKSAPTIRREAPPSTKPIASRVAPTEAAGILDTPRNPKPRSVPPNSSSPPRDVVPRNGPVDAINSSPHVGVKRAASGPLSRPMKKATVDIFNRGGAATKKRLGK